MGRIRPVYVKRKARELLQLYPDRFSTDYIQNREQIRELIAIESKIVINKIAGYMTSLLKRKEKK